MLGKWTQVLGRKKAVAGMVVGLCVVLVSSAAFATLYYTDWDTYRLLLGTNYLTTTSTTQARYEANQFSRGEACHATSATLYRGGNYVYSVVSPPGGMLSPDQTFWGADTGTRTTALTGANGLELAGTMPNKITYRIALASTPMGVEGACCRPPAT